MLQLILGIGVLHDAAKQNVGIELVAEVHEDHHISDLNRLRSERKMKQRQAEKRRVIAEREAEQTRISQERRAQKRAEKKRSLRLAKAKADALRKAKLEANRQLKKKKAALKREQDRRQRIAMKRQLKNEAKKRKAEAKRQAELRRKAEAKRQAELRRKAEAKRQAELRRKAEAKRQAELRRKAEAKRQAELRRKAEAKRQAKLERLRQQRIAEAKIRAEVELKRKRKAAQLERQAKMAEKRRLRRQKEQAKAEAERLAQEKEARRLKGLRFAKMQAAKEKAIAKAEAQRRAERRANRDLVTDIGAVTTVSVALPVDQAESTRDKTRAQLQKERQWGIRGWNPSRHRRNMNGSKWHPKYWGAGVFYYNADTPEVTVIENNTTIVNEAPQTVVHKTERSVDFRKSLSVGIRGGASTPDLNDGVTDAGLGVAIGYRLFEPVGVELSYVHQGDRIDLSQDSPLQATGKLFLFPWSNVNPYVSGGINIAEREDETLDYGAHGGLGVQFGTGKTAFNVEARYSGFEGSEHPSTISAIMGVDYHF